jgi:hypothetical protein
MHRFYVRRRDSGWSESHFFNGLLWRASGSGCYPRPIVDPLCAARDRSLGGGAIAGTLREAVGIGRARGFAFACLAIILSPVLRLIPKRWHSTSTNSSCRDAAYTSFRRSIADSVWVHRIRTPDPTRPPRSPASVTYLSGLDPQGRRKRAPREPPERLDGVCAGAKVVREVPSGSGPRLEFPIPLHEPTP